MCRNLHHPLAWGDAKNLCSVVMPDHIHLLLQLGDTPLQRVVNRMKSRSAIKLNRQIGRTGRFWAPGYYDHALRAEEDLRGVARYIVANPLRAGLVRNIGDYPFWNAIWL
jgi:REP element-mobilizing transposase RayT